MTDQPCRGCDRHDNRQGRDCECSRRATVALYQTLWRSPLVRFGVLAALSGLAVAQIAAGGGW
ncbi:MAG TPA: hypothetical protein VGE22_12485 [Solimonas sp.]